MGWFKLKYVLFLLAIIIIGVILYQYQSCKKKGDKLGGQAFNCGFLKSNPKPLKASEEYYKIKEGKCMRFTDYGASMNIKEVEMSYCQN